jgi:hypothetical protein
MPAVSFTSTDLFTGILSLLFTVMILSYVVGDNVAFRLAIHVFIGVSAGYVALIVGRQVIVDKMIVPLFVGGFLDRVLVAIPLVLGLILLLTKTSSNLEGLGRWLVAFMVGTGAAAAVAGAIMGTLFPQVLSTINLFDLDNTPGALGKAGNLGTGIVILLGTVTTLAYFQFTVFGKGAPTGKRGTVMRVVAMLGQVFIVITLGALFAGTFSAALTAFIDRIHSIVLFFDLLFF